MGRLQGESCCPQPDRGNPAVRDETGGRRKLIEARNEAPSCSDEEPVTATPRCPPTQRLRSIPTHEPADTDVCTEEIIRFYGAVGADLQKQVHEDMTKNFSAYPGRWRWLLGKPGSSIDHRRVPNLMGFFQRNVEGLPVTTLSVDCQTGIPRYLGYRWWCVSLRS